MTSGSAWEGKGYPNSLAGGEVAECECGGDDLPEVVLVEDVVDGSDHVLGHLVAGLARVKLVLGVRGVHRSGDLQIDFGSDTAAHRQGLLSVTFLTNPMLPKGKSFPALIMIRLTSFHKH